MASPHVVGRYVLHDKIAGGGMATVYFGRQTGAAGFARTVAVKRLHPHLVDETAFRSTMIDEARLAARIHHPNVVPTLDVVAVSGELLLVMEYVRGESLARLLRAEAERGRRAPLAIVSAVIQGALYGLHAAHEATSDLGEPLGIVHRDVSPENILVGIDGMPRVIDFGVAKAVGRLQTTREGIVKGKVSYMAPEHLEGRDVSRSVDVYAMAIVLWEALAGRRLFEADDSVQLMVKVLSGPEHAPSHFVPGLPPELDAIVMRALALDPRDRFASAEAMAEALRRVVPPAFPTDVGRWVQEVAEDPLQERANLLAAIESGSRLASATHSAAEPPGAELSSSGSAATRPLPIPRRRSGRLVLTFAGMIIALGLGASVLAARRAQPPRALEADVAPAVAAAAPGPVASAAVPSTAPPLPEAASPAASPARNSAGGTGRPEAGTRRVRPVPRPSGSIRFVEPD